MNSENNRPIIIGIAGGSGTGKSTLVSKNIKNAFQSLFESKIISQDDFRKNREYKNKINSIYKWDDPKMFSIKECQQFLLSLSLNSNWRIPIYDNNKFQRTGSLIITPSKLVLFEGIYALQDDLNRTYSLKIYVESPLYARMIKRVIRGVKKYKYKDCNNLIFQFLNSVTLAHSTHVIKQKKYADIVVSDTLDFQMLISEYKLKSTEIIGGIDTKKIKLQKFLYLCIIKNKNNYLLIKYKNKIYFKCRISSKTEEMILNTDLFSL